MPAPFMTMLPSAARIVTGNGDSLNAFRLAEWDNGRAAMMRAQLNITALSGTATPTLTALIEDSVDGANWNTVGSFAAATTVSRQVINIGLRGDAYPAGFAWPFNGRYMRVRWTISGTNPSFTFAVTAVLL